jgi:MoxR-like ATPase
MAMNDWPARIRVPLAHLDASFVERLRELRLVFLTLLSGHHAILLGPPGTGKSLLSRAICQAFGTPTTDARYFEYLLTRFTHPDELFGPISIPALKNEDYRRLTEGYLPDADIAFLDEVFKANSAILNSLLGLINERIFHCGKRRIPVPLIGLIAASNEPPEPDAGLAALHDRFLTRLTVAPIDHPDAFLAVVLGELPSCAIPPSARLTPSDLADLRATAARVTAPTSVRGALVAFRDALRKDGLTLSDRRFRSALDLLRTAAATSGRAALAPIDLLLLEHVFDSADAPRARHALRTALEPLFSPETQFHALWAALLQDDAPNLKAERIRRLDAVLAIDADLTATFTALDALRESTLADLRASPWLSRGTDPDPDALARVLTMLATARRKFELMRDLVTAYRDALTHLGPHLQGDVLERLRRAQTSRNPTATPEDVVVWLAPPDAEPEEWVPVSEDGFLLFDTAPRIAGRIQRRLVDETLATGRSFDATPAWHTTVLSLPLTEDCISALLSSWFELQHHLLSAGFPPASRVAAALRALSEWLRAAGVPRLPPPPHLPDELTR